MRATIVFIIILCLIPIAAYITCKKTGTAEKSFSGYKTCFLLCFIVGLFLIGLVNGASPEIVTVNGSSESECINHQYFLLYKASNDNAGSKYFFIPPYSKDKVYNNTNEEIDYQIVRYEYHGSGEAQLDECFHIKPHSLFTSRVKTEYCFKPIPRSKRLYDKNHTTAYYGVLIRSHYSVEYRD